MAKNKARFMGYEYVHHDPNAKGAKFEVGLQVQPYWNKDTKRVEHSVSSRMSRVRLKALYRMIGRALEATEPAANSHNNPYRLKEAL